MKKKYFILFLTLLIVFINSHISYADYVAGKGDLLNISVYSHPDLNISTRISGNGDINFPLIGTVSVFGLKIPEIEMKIAKLLADGYIVKPFVTVVIKESRTIKISVNGEVKRPGLYEYTGNATLLEIISKSEGVTVNASDYIFVQRKNNKGSSNKKTESIKVDLNKLLTGQDKSVNINLKDGDNIYVPKAPLFYINGEVKIPGSYKVIAGLTVMKAVTIAGGFSDSASKNLIEITREKEPQKPFQAKLNEIVIAGDLIYIPENSFYVNGEVNKPGVYKITSQLTVLKAITFAGGFTDKASKSKIKIIRKEKDGKEIIIKVGLKDFIKPEDVITVPESLF